MNVLFPAPFSPSSACTSPERASEVRSAQGSYAAETLRDGGSLKVHVAFESERRLADQWTGQAPLSRRQEPAASCAVISIQSGLIGSVRPGERSGNAVWPISSFCIVSLSG